MRTPTHSSPPQPSSWAKEDTSLFTNSGDTSETLDCIEPLLEVAAPISLARRPSSGRSREQARLDNDVLFERRTQIRDRIAELRTQPEDETTVEELERAQRALENITAQIVEENLGLVHDFVRKFAKVNLEASEEYFAAGSLGLVVAIDSYDPSKGTFGHWAHKPIKREVLHALRATEHHNMQMHDFEMRQQVMGAADRLSDPSQGIRPSLEEVATEAGKPIAAVKRILEAPAIVSLSSSRPTSNDPDGSALEHDVASGEEDFTDGIATRFGLNALERYGLPVLNDREREVLSRHWGLAGHDPVSLGVMATEMGISREAVRRIGHVAMSKLLHPVVLRRLMREGRD